MPDGSTINPFTTADQMTLANVLERIDSDESLSTQRRRNLCSALRGLGKLMNRDLSYLPPHPGFYRSIFKGLHPEHCGLTAGRIRNIKTDVQFAFKHTGCIHGTHTYMAPFSPAWQALWNAAECAGRLRCYASRLMHYCSAQGIPPDAVDDAVADSFLKALVDESFVQDPIHTFKGILCTWNKLVDAVPGWPGTKLIVPCNKETYTIPLDRFPKPFQGEIYALVEHWAGNDILDEDGPAKPLKPRTIKSRLYRNRQIVSALVLRGWKIETITSLATIVEFDAAKVVLRFYLDRAGGNTTSQVHGLAILIKTLAKHWVKVDEASLKSLKALCAKVDPAVKGMTEKNKTRLRQLDDPKNVALLLNFPACRVDEIRRSDRGRRRDAVAIQIALAVELLLMAPVRAENLVNINTERHIQRTRSGKGGVVHLVIPGAEVKNEEDLEFELPSATVDLLDLYLKDYHPRLVSGPCPWLFPGKENKPKTREHFGDQVSRHVFKATGLRVNLHLFRHIAAKLYLDLNPGGYEVVRRLLGHRSMETTIRFYAGMEHAAAGRHFDAEILRLRRSLSSGNTGS